MQNYQDNENFNLMSRAYAREMYLNSYPKNRINAIIPYHVSDNVEYKGNDRGFSCLVGWLNLGQSGGDYGVINDMGNYINIVVGAGSQSIFGVFDRITPNENFTFIGWKLDIEPYYIPAEYVGEYIYSTFATDEINIEEYDIRYLIPLDNEDGHISEPNNYQVGYLPFEGNIRVKLGLPSNGLIDLFPYILPAGLNIEDEYTYNSEYDIWFVTVNFDGSIEHEFHIVKPALVAVFKIDGETLMYVPGEVDFIEGVYYWENANFGNPTYNNGFGYRMRYQCKLRFNNFPALSAGDLPLLVDEYDIPAGLYIDNSTKYWNHYIIECTFSGAENKIFNFLPKLAFTVELIFDFCIDVEIECRVWDQYIGDSVLYHQEHGAIGVASVDNVPFTYDVVIGNTYTFEIVAINGINNVGLSLYKNGGIERAVIPSVHSDSFTYVLAAGSSYVINFQSFDVTP